MSQLCSTRLTFQALDNGLDVLQLPEPTLLTAFSTPQRVQAMKFGDYSPKTVEVRRRSTLRRHYFARAQAEPSYFRSLFQNKSKK